MQPQYTIRWSDDFVADVTAICGTVEIFERAFSGFGWYLSRLPRGTGTWDLSGIGELRLAHLPAATLDDGTHVPGTYFTFELHLGEVCYLELLRAFHEEDPALVAVVAGTSA